ncbi:regulator of chromosome condensation 1/beta-lactamase-inhibitor protein II [Jimgerdemannia flammicorona]|uniref:Regulator of chromosome condensation 1/beta-lactamase-inhibitor protein II n=1 Tax=Jimgerdemannia flammicorona TaxID=994334 RepID=A0A433DEA5_9FUNG|nr:regulator of chromosome condensation 1/beta-lactamase-inhibitor protein II [Jimgerdemannia flammicorona]
MDRIPVEVLLENVLPRLSLASILAVSATSKFFYHVVDDEVLWQTLTLRDFKLPLHSTFRQIGWRRLYSKLWDPIVYTWGEGSNARLGHPAVNQPNYYGRYRNEPLPRELVSLRGKGIVDIIAGGYSFHVLDRNGTVWMWGMMSDWLANDEACEEPTHVNLPVPIRSISCGRVQAMALGKDGRVFQWLNIRNPMEIVLDSASPVVQIAAGWGFSAALTADGEVFYIPEGHHRVGFSTVNYGTEGENDDGSNAEQPKLPKKEIHEHVTLTGLLASTHMSFGKHNFGVKFTRIACGEHFMIALTNAGAVFKFDTSTALSFMNPLLSEHLAKFGFHTGEQDVSSSERIIGHISAFFREFAAYNREGTVFWGDREFNADTSPIMFSELQSGICQISIGDWHKGAITADGKLLTWGEPSAGALGHTTAKIKPTLVKGELANKFVFSIGFGGWHSGVLAVDLGA